MNLVQCILVYKNDYNFLNHLNKRFSVKKENKNNYKNVAHVQWVQKIVPNYSTGLGKNT